MAGVTVGVTVGGLVVVVVAGMCTIHHGQGVAGGQGGRAHGGA